MVGPFGDFHQQDVCVDL